MGYLQSRYPLKHLLFTPPTFSFTGIVVTNERAQEATVTGQRGLEEDFVKIKLL